MSGLEPAGPSSKPASPSTPCKTCLGTELAPSWHSVFSLSNEGGALGKKCFKSETWVSSRSTAGFKRCPETQSYFDDSKIAIYLFFIWRIHAMCMSRFFQRYYCFLVNTHLTSASRKIWREWITVSATAAMTKNSRQCANTWSLGSCFRRLARSLWIQIMAMRCLILRDGFSCGVQSCCETRWRALRAGGEMGTWLCHSTGGREWVLLAAQGGIALGWAPKDGEKADTWCRRGKESQRYTSLALPPWGWRVKVWSPVSSRHIPKHMFV